MIELNHRAYPYQAGMTVASLMAENNFVFNDIIVKINGNIIEDELWPNTNIADNDDVEIIHIFGGG